MVIGVVGVYAGQSNSQGSRPLLWFVGCVGVTLATISHIDESAIHEYGHEGELLSGFNRV